MAFNFQARVQLTGPYNVAQVAQQIRAQLSNVQAKVNLQVSSAGLQQIGQINSALYGFSNVSKKAGADLKALNNDIYNFGEQAGLATRRFLAFSVAAGAITGIVVGFKRGVSAAVEFQKELVRFDQISGDTQQSIRGIASEVTRLATTFGVSSKELVQSATVLRQAGLSAREVKTALEALSLAALSPNFGKMTENVEGLIAVTSQFKIKTDDLKQAFGSINAVAGDYAVEAKDIIDATIRAGGAFATLGGNLNEFLAIFTTVRATTRESADTIATGLRTIFARLQQSDTVDALKDLQINLRHTGEEAQRLGNINLTGQFVGPYEAIRRLSEGLKDLPSTDPRFAAVVEQIGGIRQISRVLPLLQQDKLRENVLRTATLGTGSLQPGADKAQESLSNRIDKTRESFEKLFRTIANDKGFQAFAKTLLDIASFTAKVTENLTPLISVLGTAAIFKTISSVTQFGSGFVNKFSNDKSKPYYNVRGFATGDVVPGSGNTDSVAANLMPGEFVFRKDAVKNIGIDNLRTLHQRAHVGAGVRHFAQGGYAEGGLFGRAKSFFSGLFGNKGQSQEREIDLSNNTNAFKLESFVRFNKLIQTQLKSLGIDDFFKTDLYNSPELRAKALKDPDLFNRQSSSIKSILGQAMKFGDTQQAGFIRGKLDELTKLQDALGQHVEKYKPQEPDTSMKFFPDFYGKKGGRSQHINQAISLLKEGKSRDEVESFLVNENLLAPTTAKKYAGDALRRYNLLGSITQNFTPPSRKPLAEGGLLGGNIGTAIKRLTSISSSNLAAVVAGLGLRAGGDNDAYTLEALLKAKRKEGEAVVSSYRPKKYAEGGLHTEVPDLVKSLAGRTGIKLDKFFKKITFNDENFGYGDNALGTFSNKDKAINLNLNKIGDSSQLKRTLTHEIGHSLDYGGNSVPHSNRSMNEELQEALLSLSPKSYHPSYKKQSSLLRESFAETFRVMMGYGDLKDNKNIQFARPEQVPAVAQQIDKILGRYREDFPYKKFATGGSVGATDVVPAALTPGEFIFSPEATSRIGVANLHRANKSGDISHLMAGVTGFHRGGYVGFAAGGLNLATGSNRKVESSSVLDEVIRGNGTTKTFDVNKQQQYMDALASQLQKVAQAEGVNLTATQALAKAKTEFVKILALARDVNNQALRREQTDLATTISDKKFNPGTQAGQALLSRFEQVSALVNPVVEATKFNKVGNTVVGQGKFSNEDLYPSPKLNSEAQLKKLVAGNKLPTQFYDSGIKGVKDTTIAQLLAQTGVGGAGGGSYTKNTLRDSIEKVLTTQYQQEAKASGLHITQLQLQTKARAESTRLINLASSKEYTNAVKDLASTSKKINSPNFDNYSVKKQQEIIEKNTKAAAIVDDVTRQTAIAAKDRRNLVGVGGYVVPEKPLLSRDLTGPASKINPISPLFTSDRDNGFIQKLTKTGTYNTSVTNLLASGVDKDKIREQLESAIQSQLKREYEESGKAIAASELITRSKIGAAKILEVASSKEVQAVNRKVAAYEKIIADPGFIARTKDSKQKIEDTYNVYKTRQNELNELTAVRTQGTDIIGRGGDLDKNSAKARRERFNYGALVASQIALPLISSQVNSFAGEAEANLNNRAKYTSLRTGGGALEGGAIGATIGSFTGIPAAPIITGIFGALIGGIVSFVNAGEELRKAKLGETLTSLALNISTAAREIEQNGRIGVSTRDSAQNTLRQGLSLLKPENANQSSIGRALGAERGLGQALNTLLEDDIRRLVKDNPNLSSSDIQNRLEADPNRENVNFRGGNIQANRYQLLSLASTGDAASPAQRANFTQFIDSIRRSLSSEGVTREINRLANAFGLLAGYVDSTSSSFDKVESSIETSLNILGGRGGPERLRLPTDVSSVNPFSNTFGQNFNEQLSPFGAVGVQIGSRANDFQALAQQLPNVINDIFASGQVNRGGFRDSLNSRTNNGFSATVIGEQAGRIFDELAGSGKLSREEIQSGIIEKLGKQFQSIVPALERVVNLTNTYATVLNEAAKAQNEAIRFNLQANQAGLESERIGGQIRAVQAGRSDGFNFTSRAAFERPFNNNIEQLLAGTPLAGRNNSIADISRAFQGTVSDAQDIRAGRPQAADLARRVAGTLGGSAGGLFPGIGGTASAFGATPVNPAAATQSLNKLAEQGNKYRQVLEAYTNVTARAARANEDLSQIRGDRQGRANLVDRFVTGDANQQSEILRGLHVVQGLRDTPGGLRGLGQENAALAVSTLQGLGQTRINIGGQRIAADQYLQQERERAFPELFANLGKEEVDALKELQKINEEAKKAYSALGDANKIFSDKANAWAVDIFNKNAILMGDAANTLNKITVPGPSNPANGQLDFREIFNRFLPSFAQIQPGNPAGPNVVPPAIRDTLTPTQEALEKKLRGIQGPQDNSGGFGFYADGGSVFKPKGTDTVPAMLSPGEFIVNAASTKANYSLLKQINDSRQPIYRAGGGFTLPEGYEDLIRRTIRNNPREQGGDTEFQDRQRRETNTVRLARGAYDSPAELLRNSLTSVQGGIDYYQRANSRNVQGQQAASYLADSDNPFDRLIYGMQARSYGERITNAAANFRALRRPNETEIGQIRDLNLGPANPPLPQIAGRPGQRRIPNRIEPNRVQPTGGELPNLDGDEIARRNAQLADLRRRGLVPGAPASLVPRFSGDNRPDNPNSVRTRVAGLSPEEIVRRNAELARLRNSGLVPGAPPRLVPPAGFNGRNDGRPNNPTLNDDPDFVRRRELAQRLANAPSPAGLPTLSPDEVARRNAQLENLRRRGLVPGAPSNSVPRFRPQGFANGGFVGTDTIPAMLSPGEFVVNPSATASNLSLLRHLNTTASPVYRAAGGLIGASPGSASDGGSAFNSGLTQALASFGDSSKTLATALQSFAGTANELAASIARFPTKMEVSVTHNVNVNHNGTQAFATMKEELATLVIGETQSRLQDTFKTAFPDVNISFTGASIK